MADNILSVSIRSIMEPPVNVSDDITTIINLAFLSASESMIITASPVDGEKYMQSVVIPSAAVIPCQIKTSTCLSFVTISLGLYRFIPICDPRVPNCRGGPLKRGRLSLGYQCDLSLAG